MNRKHYNEIAKIFADLSLGTTDDTTIGRTINWTRERIAKEIADVLQQESSRFDRDRFLAACNLENVS
jgi:hypothetical protein